MLAIMLTWPFVHSTPDPSAKARCSESGTTNIIQSGRIELMQDVTGEADPPLRVERVGSREIEGELVTGLRAGSTERRRWSGVGAAPSQINLPLISQSPVGRQVAA